MIKILENALGRKAKLNFMPRQPGDVHDTHANIELLEKMTGYLPKTDLETGISRFLAWYKEFYRISWVEQVMILCIWLNRPKSFVVQNYCKRNRLYYKYLKHASIID